MNLIESDASFTVCLDSLGRLLNDWIDLDNSQVSLSLTKKDTTTKVPEEKKDNHPPNYKLRVIVCDDSVTNSKILSKILQRRKYDVTTFYDGKYAVQDVALKDLMYYDVIYLDNIMPILNGRETCQKLREMGFSNLIVGITGSALQEDLNEFMNAGLDAVLTKPLELKNISIIEDYIKNNLCTTIDRTKLQDYINTCSKK